MSLERIPLFPLEVVLFPGAPLPLHIFEPRYKLMVGRCLERRTPFGVILARSERIAAVGCTAEIVRIVKKHDDGRMDILTEGRAAYHVVDVHQDEAYLEGSVEYLDDDSSPASAETQKKLLALYDQAHGLVYGAKPEALEISGGRSLAFQIASDLPLDLEYKQELLEMRVEAERQTRLLERLEHWLPQLAYLERVRGKAAGNGHGMRR